MSLKNTSFTASLLTGALSTGMTIALAGCDKADVRLDAQGQGTFSMPISQTQQQHSLVICREKSNTDCATYTTAPKVIASGNHQDTLILNVPDGSHEAACAITPQPDVMVPVYDGDQVQYVCGPGFNIGKGSYDMECGLKLAPHYHPAPKAQEDLASCRISLPDAKRSQTPTPSIEENTRSLTKNVK